MTESATLTVDGRRRRRAEASHLITVRAQRLVDAHGVDGFTMDDLAEAAGVSRRTLFNYFDSKVDAILGRIPEVPDALVAEFRRGGPHGDLISDLGVLAAAVLTDHHATREEVALGRRVLRVPRLYAASHERFAAYVEPFVELMREREGPAYDEVRARCAVNVFVAIADMALDGFVAEPHGRPLAEIYTDLLATTRSLMAPGA